MKVCTKCGETNNDNDLICVNCNSSSKSFIDYNEATEVSQNNIIIKNKLKRNIIRAILTISFLIITVLVFLNIKNGTLSFGLIFSAMMFMITGLITIKFTEEVFLFTHMFSLRNLTKGQMSDMYDTYLKISGVGLVFSSVIVLIIPLIN